MPTRSTSGSTSALPPAVVVGLDCITGLQTARILARRRVPVIGIAANGKHFCARTRVCSRIVTSPTAGDGLVECLEALGPELAEKGVLFPCADLSVLAISRGRERLAAWYHVLLPRHAVVEMLTDKVSFTAYAQSAGFPIPRTFALRTRHDAEHAAAAVRYPSVLKPAVKTPEWQRRTTKKAFKVESAYDLLSLYDRCAGWVSPLLVQEWVSGGDEDLYTCNCYFGAGSTPLVTFVTRKIRQWPPQTGTGCLAVECRNDVVLEQTIRLFRSVGFSGLGYVEMKRDTRTGEHLVLETNVGRPTGRSAIAEAGGVELLYAAYCDAIGLPLPPNLEQQYRGVKWIYFRRDLQSAVHHRRRGELTLREWWRSIQGPKTDAVFSWRDPVPFLADFWGAGLTLLGLRRRRPGRSSDEKPLPRAASV